MVFRCFGDEVFGCSGVQGVQVFQGFGVVGSFCCYVFFGVREGWGGEGRRRGGWRRGGRGWRRFFFFGRGRGGRVGRFWGFRFFVFGRGEEGGFGVSGLWGSGVWVFGVGQSNWPESKFAQVVQNFLGHQKLA